MFRVNEALDFSIRLAPMYAIREDLTCKVSVWKYSCFRMSYRPFRRNSASAHECDKCVNHIHDQGYVFKISKLQHRFTSQKDVWPIWVSVLGAEMA